jgi:hypothetical protein
LQGDGGTNLGFTLTVQSVIMRYTLRLAWRPKALDGGSPARVGSRAAIEYGNGFYRREGRLGGA